MKRYWWMAVMMAGVARLCTAQTATGDELGGDDGVTALEDVVPWTVSGELLYQNFFYEHDSLQQRQPYDSGFANEWENGKTSGNGYGFGAIVGQGDGALNVIFRKSDYKFEYSPTAGGRQQIDTENREFEITWSQHRGRNDLAIWGSNLGFRYLSLLKDVAITEATTTFVGDADQTWLLLTGGYYAKWRPFRTDIFEAHGAVNFLLGEADGTARQGSDTNWTDDVISEVYSDETSLAYGANASFGVTVEIVERLDVTVDYMREWLYSFDATDTGIVVFPDNNDALFIENRHSVLAALRYRF